MALNLIEKLKNKGLIDPPKYIYENLQYLVYMGSIAYGTSNLKSDVDVYGFCIPPKEIVFPHLAGEIEGFGRQKQRFNQWQKHHVLDKDNGREYDFQVYNITKYFHLCMENNPNMIDSLFVPENCVIYQTDIARKLRENRQFFLHKGSWHKFKGYAYSQLHKAKNKNPEGKRKKIVDEYGYDVKFASHVIRLISEIEQIMMEGDLDLQKNREQIKSVRRGEWTFEQVEEWFNNKEKELGELYINSSLRHSPDEDFIKSLLVECMEDFYGNINDGYVPENKYKDIVDKIKKLIENV